MHAAQVIHVSTATHLGERPQHSLLENKKRMRQDAWEYRSCKNDLSSYGIVEIIDSGRIWDGYGGLEGVCKMEDSLKYASMYVAAVGKDELSNWQ